ncbi:MAG: carboxynorspermidine decarboxylase [Alphaproteobacteria bacterium]|nr:MAG: carboxynorspermidine decarboxylase [Alphaproteobacteria bacterium]TAF41240.1 MAG: carboxynorspermidine decarboxylase [Alphaproteobacteria bacterium]TAF75119.1 MAG: carboxynorspermidine decarboxylase [Alphaproteobacteria bacterium]
MVRLPIDRMATPAYVADVAAIKHNLSVAARIKQETGCTMLLATKAFAMPALFPMMAEVLDGTTASGLYEARLGHEHFGGEVHAYSPAFTAKDMDALAKICDHISFNSVAQLEAFGGRFAHAGLRVNPRLSLVRTNSIYDPSAANSRFGVEYDALTPEVLKRISYLHVHNLCENHSDASVALIEHMMRTLPHALDAVDYVNIGGGHYFTHPDYDIGALCHAVRHLQQTHGVRVIIESGAAHVYDAGYLVARVVDVVQRSDVAIAVLDVSATCHMPDVLEVPYRPHVIGDDEAHPHAYILAGNTCLTGDVIGTYHFAKQLKVGDAIIFTDMMQYSFVKNTTFNGMPLPDLAILDEAGDYHVVKSFGYEDFARKLCILP